MRKSSQIILWLYWLSGLLLSFLNGYVYSSSTVGSVLSVLSIFFGFYLASLTVLWGTNIFRSLHGRIDPVLNKRESHILLDSYKFGFFTLVVSVIFFLVILIVPFDGGWGVIFSAIASAQLVMCMAFVFVHLDSFLILMRNDLYITQGHDVH